MNFEEWEPVYERILDDFGYDRRADEAARDVLDSLTTPFDLGTLGERIDGRRVAVVGAAPSLADNVDAAADADVVVAASTAADVLADAGVAVDAMVTDLDKNPDTAGRLTREGTPVAVHAHGDNVAAVREWVPRYEAAWVLPTTQARPRGAVVNVGGFTDGDRAAFLADHLDAASLRFVGWEFDDPSVGPTKARKLRWAARLLAWLERRRDEQFDVLDGVRSDLDPVTE